MEISHVVYELMPKARLNAQVAVIKPRQGALLQVDGGYADLFPWPELGDESLEKQLESLRQKKPRPLALRSLATAKIDAEARAQRRSLFSGLEIPESHRLLPDPLHLSQENLAQSLEEGLKAGFQRFKFKMGHDFAEQKNLLESAAQILAGTSAQLRLDFNETLSDYDAQLFFSQISEVLLDRIDFIEDPSPWDESRWSDLAEKFSLRLGLDRRLDAALGEESKGFELCVLKPAVNEPQKVLAYAHSHLKRVSVTSYLDHPLGQMSAAYWAARAHQEHPLLLESCGLLTHMLYEAHAFSELVQSVGPRLLPPQGTGLGFDEQLKGLPWKRL